MTKEAVCCAQFDNDNLNVFQLNYTHLTNFIIQGFLNVFLQTSRDVLLSLFEKRSFRFVYNKTHFWS